MKIVYPVHGQPMHRNIWPASANDWDTPAIWLHLLRQQVQGLTPGDATKVNDLWLQAHLMGGGSVLVKSGQEIDPDEPLWAGIYNRGARGAERTD